MSEDRPYFSHHVFICMNQREGGRECCADKGSHAAQKYLKSRVKELGLAGPGEVRINQSGCLDRCEEGPVLVVYPEGTWYTYVDNEDLDEIIDEHLVHGRIVDRLKI
ncbi:MAG TPA: (2Fe-2S) ferredoxin domain-containing protein [Oxalicibacterium sp.]|nr:(2Fe-2S) ferredoxin domain-containing protein [Oxalicibacterium sp.]